MSEQILLVEDDPALAALIADYLRQNGFEVSVEPRGDLAVSRIIGQRPHLVILDLMLPGEDGLSICRRVRAHYSGLILMLTARGDAIDQVAGLELGADDYVAKPVNPRVLVARIRALLRRAASTQPTEEAEALEIGRLRIEPAARRAWVSGKELELSSAELDLLWLLASNAGRVLSRQSILDRLRGVEYDGIDRSIDMRVSKLRQKIGDDPRRPQIIKTIRGVGYIYVLG